MRFTIVIQSSVVEFQLSYKPARKGGDEGRGGGKTTYI
jgi:hypothetical protein